MKKFLSFSKIRKTALFYWTIFTSIIQAELANAAVAPSPDAVIANARNVGLGVTTLLPILAVVIGGVFIIIFAILLVKRGDQQEAREASVLKIVLTGIAGGLLLAFGLTSDFFSQLIFGSAGANAHAGVGAAF